jgi:hypothetical protein
MEHCLTESLTLGVRAEIGFEAEGVDGGDESCGNEEGNQKDS